MNETNHNPSEKKDLADAPSPDSAEHANSEPIVYAFVLVEDGEHRALSVDQDMLVGRGVKVHIQLKDRTVSRQHGVVMLTNEGCVYEDLLSDNGSFINGERVVRRVLLPGDTVLLGSYPLHYLGPKGADAQWEGRPWDQLPPFRSFAGTKADATTLHVEDNVLAMIEEMVGKPAILERHQLVAEVLERACLQCEKSGDRHFPRDGRLLLGGEGGIRISKLFNKKSAEVHWDGFTHILTKHGGYMSRVKVNGQAITEPHRLAAKDRISVGGTHFLYVLDTA